MNRLKFLRKEKKLSQTDVAELLNITRQGYASYENEITQPTPIMLIKLADIFGCSIDFLLCREDEMGNVPFNKNLTKEEIELLEIYNNQQKQGKSYLLTFARGLNNHTL